MTGGGKGAGTERVNKWVVTVGTQGSVARLTSGPPQGSKKPCLAVTLHPLLAEGCSQPHQLQPVPGAKQERALRRRLAGPCRRTALTAGGLGRAPQPLLRRIEARSHATRGVHALGWRGRPICAPNAAIESQDVSLQDPCPFPKRRKGPSTAVV